MLTVRSTINIASQTVPPIIPVVQGDTGRAILFTLADFTIPAGASATYYVQKPSGEAVYNNATIDGNTVLVELTAQSIIEKGDNYGQVRITVGEDVVTSFDFILLVKEFRGIDAVQSLTEMNIFDKAVEQAAEEIDEVKNGALNDIGDAKDAALQEIEQSTGNFADAFSASTTYVAGDYVIHSGQLYRFTANHAAGAWTGSDAEAVTVGEELTDLKADTTTLKEELGDITETVYSSNIFDQANATLTEGKYLNYTNGNVGTNASYCYVNDYIPVKANIEYFGTTFNKTTLARNGYFAAFILFYDSSKAFISGLGGGANQNPFTTPANAAYMRISETISAVNNNYIMFEESTTSATTYVPYSESKKLKMPFVLVDASGKGDFTTISDAINDASSGDTILVASGTYEEAVSAWGKEIHIIGMDRESCILKDSSGNYSTPPLEIGAGSVQNMTIIEQAEGAGTENWGAYAIHIEDNNLFNKKLLIRNCYIESDSSSAIGMGLRGGCSVRIEDCEIICAGARASTSAAPLYFHDADSQAYFGVANLYLHNNVLRNTASTLFSMLTINSIHKENTTYMHMMYNIFVRSKTPALSQKFNTWNTSGNTDADGWNGLSHMYLEDDSFGNNLSELNYSV